MAELVRAGGDGGGAYPCSARWRPLPTHAPNPQPPQAAADEDASVEIDPGPRPRLAWRWTVATMQRAAEAAPGPAEALVVEHMRQLMGGSGRVAEVRRAVAVRPAAGALLL